jgi:hypothetical protein
MAGTNKVVKLKRAEKPFKSDDFTIVEAADRIPPHQEVVFEGSFDQCDEYIRKNVPPAPKKKIKK